MLMKGPCILFYVPLVPLCFRRLTFRDRESSLCSAALPWLNLIELEYRVPEQHQSSMTRKSAVVMPSHWIFWTWAWIPWSHLGSYELECGCYFKAKGKENAQCTSPRNSWRTVTNETGKYANKPFICFQLYILICNFQFQFKILNSVSWIWLW